MTMKINQQHSNVVGLHSLSDGSLDPGVEGVIDQLGLLTTPLNGSLRNVTIALHLAPVNVTLDNMRLEAILAEYLV